MSLDGGEVTLEGICDSLLLLPHEGSSILMLTGVDEGHDKGRVDHGYIARSNDNRVSDGGGDDRGAWSDKVEG
jgi:hypothetical protein